MPRVPASFQDTNLGAQDAALKVVDAYLILFRNMN